MIIQPDTYLFSHRKTLGFVRERDFHIESEIKIASIARKAAVPTRTNTPAPQKARDATPITSVARLSQVRRTAVQGRMPIRGLRGAIHRRHVCAPLLILTLSRVGNYHEQFIYRRVGCKSVSLSPPGGTP